MRFLVIDDDELSRELLAMLLGAEGHEVDVAASGEEALGLLGRVGGMLPEVILADMQMPGVSGAALAVALRQACGEETRLLAMSGSRSSEAALGGFDGFLMKPFAIDDLEAWLVRKETTRRLHVAPEVTGAATEPPALDEDIYGKMAQMMPGAQLSQMYAMCLADARTRLSEMSRLAAAGDDAGFRKAAHTVKGGCGMIGAAELYKLAEAAESSGLESNSGLPVGTSSVTALLERFSRACDRLERILGERKQANSAPASGE